MCVLEKEISMLSVRLGLVLEVSYFGIDNIHIQSSQDCFLPVKKFSSFARTDMHFYMSS